jgi:hypothetical protein
VDVERDEIPEGVDPALFHHEEIEVSDEEIEESD